MGAESTAAAAAGERRGMDREERRRQGNLAASGVTIVTDRGSSVCLSPEGKRQREKSPGA